MKPFFMRILSSLDVRSTLSPAEGNIEKYAPLVFLIGILVLCSIPFLNKAYSIDDPLFLWSAKHIQDAPLDPYGFNVNWYRQEMPMSLVTKNPPLACYFIAATASLFGWNESAMHAIFLLPAIVVAIGTYLFAQRYCRHPLIASLAGILTPVFLISSLTIMCDVLMLAFWIFAVYFWILGLENKSPAFLVLAGLLITCAALTKYFGIMLIPFLFFYTLCRERRFGSPLLFFLLPVILLATYHWRTESLYGRGLLYDAAEYAMNRNSILSNFRASKILINFAFIGGCLASLLFFAINLWHRKVVLASVMIIAIGTYYLSQANILFSFPPLSTTTDHVLFSLQFCIWTLVGISSVVLAILDISYHRDADTLFLFLWMIGTFVFSGFINWTTNGRSILPMMIPTGILITRELERQITMNKPQKSYSGIIPLVLTAILTISVTWADYGFANTARSAAENICKKYNDDKKVVWFQGHWGYQYYMEQHGARSIDVSHVQFKRGDIIADPTTNTNIIPIPEKWVTVLDTLQLSSSQYVATMDYVSGAGFYADVFGPLPFVFGFVRPEKFIIYNFISSPPSKQ